VLPGKSYPVVSGETSVVDAGVSTGWLGDAGAEATDVGLRDTDRSDEGVDEAPPECGGTSGCFPGTGSVSRPHFSPAALNVRP